MLRNARFQTKLFLTHAFVLISVLSTIFSVFYIYLYKEYKQNSFSNLSQLSSKTAEQIDNLLSDMDRIALYVVSNPEVRSTFEEFSASQVSTPFEFETIIKKRKILDHLVAINIPEQKINKRTSIYNQNGYYISMGLPDQEEIIEQRLHSPSFDAFYQNILASAGSSKFITVHSDDWSNATKLPIISLYRVVKDILLGHPHAIVEVQCYVDNLEKIVSASANKEYIIYVFDETGSLIYPLMQEKDASLIRSYYDWSIQHPDQYDLLRNSEKEQIIISSNPSPYSGWTVTLVAPTHTIFSPLYATGLVLIFAGSFAIIFTLFIIFTISKRLTLPLRTLKDSIISVNMSNLSLEVDSFHGEDELQQLNEAFDNMFLRIQHSMDEIVQLKANEFKSYLLALQSQIDPHFLYNMLAIISASSRDNDIPKIETICQNLSFMLRYSTSYKETFVSLEDELNYTTRYMELMCERFEAGFTFSIVSNVPLTEIPLKIPKLTLQPFVENCFQHGFNHSLPPWTISIEVTYFEKQWSLCVKDNGIGINQEMITLIKERITAFTQTPEASIKSLSFGGLGLINTVARLSLLYKEHLMFEIDNNIDGGCCITIGSTQLKGDDL